MKRVLRQIMRTTPLYHPLRNLMMRWKGGIELIRWYRIGKPYPPHLVKQGTL